MALSITSITAPAQIHEGDLLILTLTTDESAALTISEGSTPLTTATGTNATAEQLLGYDSAGLHTYTFTATNANGTTSENRTVEVLDTPLTFTLDEPRETDYTGSVPVRLRTNIPADVCYTVTESATHTLVQNGTGNATSFTGTLDLADGLHTVTIKCDRNGEIAEQEVTLKVDTTPPVITLSPQGKVSSARLSATTDEVSDCRYGPSLQPYDLLPDAFPQSASLTHTVDLDLPEGSYTYSVACRDVDGNTAAPVTTSFTLSKAPTATISVEGGNPHKAGSYKVTLEASEPLSAVPQLTLTYQGGGSQRLSLTQESPTRYTGLLIVPDDAGEQVGSFTWKGTDLDGTTGTAIKDGSLFIVDTIKPGKVETFKAVNGTDGVNLTWYYDGPETTFNLYRSTSSGVDYTDFYTTSSGVEYTDYDTTSAVKYYYRIAAVDEAGNVGPLSNEEWASRAAALYAAGDTGSLLDPVLQVDLDKRLRTLESAILDAEQAVRDLKGVSDKSVAAVISTLSLNDRAAKALADLKAAKSAYAALRSRDLSRDEYKKRVTSIQRDIDAAEHQLPLSVSVGDQTTYDETPDEAVLTAAADRFLKGKVLTTSERASYDAKVSALNDAIKVVVTGTHATLALADGREQEYTIVEKRLLSQQPVSDVVAVESIPKGLAQSADIIEFLDRQPLVLQQDPVVQYSFSSLSDETIRYAVKGSIPFPTVRQARLALLPKATGSTASRTPAEPGGAVTGSATSFIGAVTGGQGLLILLGIIIIAGLLVYYFTMDVETSGAGNGGAVAQAAYALGAAMPGIVTSPLSASPLPTTFSAPATLQATLPSAQTPACSTPTILVERSREPLVGLLQRGHELADDARYLDALYFYKRALERYGKEKWPSERMKAAVQQELEQLYRKLTLFKTMMEAHDTAYAGDAQRLAELLDEMRAHAAKLEERDSPLAEKARAEYTYLYNALNRLKMGPEEQEDEKEQPL